jgi:chromosome partitioning protein
MAAKNKSFDFDRKPLPVIVAANYKGGVGKTTTTRVLVQGLATNPLYHHGKPVLYIDLDPQGNTGRRWNLLELTHESGFTAPRPHPALVQAKEENTRSSICDLWLDLLGMGESFEPLPYPSNTGEQLEAMGVIPKDVRQPVGSDFIHIVPNDENQLIAMQSFRPNSPAALEAAETLRNWLRSPELAEQYSFVVIDTAPTRTAIIDFAIHVATHIYIPFNPEPQSVDGMLSMISYFQTKISERRESEDLPLEFIGMLPNCVDMRTKIHQQQMRRLQDSPALSQYLMGVSLTDTVTYPETDNWHNTPDDVFAMTDSKTSFEASRFVKIVAQKVMESRNSWERLK